VWLIVGLGNPGSKYLLTRHNVGFMAVDYLAKSVGVRNDDVKVEHNASTISFKWENEPVKLVKPQTFMNLSGESVSALLHYYKVEVGKLIIIVDDVDLPFGKIRMRSGSGDGGHNGLKSLIQHLGNEFLRIRIGVCRPLNPEMDTADWVLKNFSKEEQAALPEILNTVTDAIEMTVFEGATKAMNEFNGPKD